MSFSEKDSWPDGVYLRDAHAITTSHCAISAIARIVRIIMVRASERITPTTESEEFAELPRISSHIDPLMTETNITGEQVSIRAQAQRKFAPGAVANRVLLKRRRSGGVALRLDG